MISPYFKEEHKLFRQSLRDFLRSEIAPHFDEWEAQQQIPRWAWAKMGEMGYLGLGHEEEYGGMDADFWYSVVFLEELGRIGNGGFGCAISVHQYMALNHIARAGSSAQKEEFLRPGIAGKKIAALAISEPDVGSNVQGIRTSATKADGYFIVNGSKTFISNAYYADFITTLVKTESGLTLLIIPGDAPGVQRTKLKKMGWHSSDTAEIHFDQVKIPESHVVGQEGMGFYYIMDSFQLERLAGGLLAVGAMDSILHLTGKYMQEREAFGRPIGKFQVLRHRMADLQTEVEACRQLAYHASWLFTQSQFAVKEASMVKLHASELQKKVADECLQMFGGYGYMEEYPICRAYRDSRVGTIAGGTSEIMREIIAKMTLDDIKYDKVY
ncbi:MAG: acyl-CoA dehydrogenase family protein [Saprospiraceae bacterium]|nr:acyl-CoA dehydrogenase family protein [Saprospiraceae bacterium]